jgi:hypothetical protein
VEFPWREPGTQPADGLDLVAGGLRRAEHAARQPQQADVAEDVVQRGQREQVLLDRRGAPQRIPVRALLLDGAHHHARQPPARGQLDAVGQQAEQQPDALRDLAHRVPHPPVGRLLVERAQPVADPLAHRFLLGMSRVGQRRQ